MLDDRVTHVVSKEKRERAEEVIPNLSLNHHGVASTMLRSVVCPISMYVKSGISVHFKYL